MVIYDTLYKRTATGAVQVWHIERDGDSYWTVSGKLDGKMVTSKPTVATPKNVGKANETTAEEQADIEVLAEYSKKQTKGKYFDSIDDIDTETYFSPMLAYPVDKYPVSDAEIESMELLSSKKYDGIRATAHGAALTSRKGLAITSMDHILDELRDLLAKYPGLTTDGELYNHRYRDQLNRISGLVRKQVLSDLEMEECRLLQYNIYDCYFDDIPDASFDERWSKFMSLTGGPLKPVEKVIDVDGVPTTVFVYPEFHISDNVIAVEQVTIPSRKVMDALRGKYLEDEYEGQMLRTRNAPYVHKRTKTLRKRKEFQDQEFRIKDIIEGTGNRAGMAGSIVYCNDINEDTFSSGIKGGEDFYKDLWDHREEILSTGKAVGTVRFFKRTEYGTPYLPVTVAVFKDGRDV